MYLNSRVCGSIPTEDKNSTKERVEKIVRTKHDSSYRQEVVQATSAIRVMRYD
ncbi:hypothetical protein L195_g002387 [Trifolium pratense]|uniref:Uncharacterized protein n=1 Tax=Trifolium pratense TaxID=57577 RepID=A0A2K3NSD2_TRIPR|nr:hypothetical protein L195_g002387 [Trifolium pratense]